MLNDMGSMVKHAEVIDRLAEHLERSGKLVVTNLTLGQVWGARYRGQAEPGKADVVAWTPSYRRKACRIYEVKVTRGDLLQDIRYGKWRKYQPYCESVVFAFPRGLATAGEIPAECGVCVWNPEKNTWHTLRAGDRRAPDGLGDDWWFAVLLNLKSRTDRLAGRVRAAKTLTDLTDWHVRNLQAYYVDRAGLSGGVRRVVDENLKLQKRVRELERAVREFQESIDTVEFGDVKSET